MKRWNQSRRVGHVLTEVRTFEKGTPISQGTFAMERCAIRVYPNDMSSVRLAVGGDTFEVRICIGLDDLAKLIRTMKDAAEIVAVQVAHHARRINEEPEP